MLIAPTLPMRIRLWAALLLAVIGLQAAAPASAVLHQTHGSAFSATTYEMAVHRQARDEEPARLAMLEPPGRAAVIVDAPAPALLLAGHAPTPRATGPPPYPIHASPSAPRAPPNT